MRVLTKEIWDILLGEFYLPLENHTCFSITGGDAVRFLNGQLTQGIEKLGDHAVYSARLNNKGQIVSWQILFKEYGCIKALVETCLVESFQVDLEKFIIMDDVELHPLEDSYDIVFGALTLKYPEASSIIFMGLPAKIIKSSERTSAAILLTDRQRSLLEVLSAHPIWGKTVVEGTLVNETIFETIGVSYDKGCFLGQETAAKIHNRRGASYSPALLVGSRELPLGSFETMGRKGGTIVSKVLEDGNWFHLCQLFREFRLEGLDLEVKQNSYEVLIGEGLMNADAKFWSRQLYHRATEIFNQDKEEESLHILELCLQLDPTFADAYEVLGVILGRLGRYEEAISYMDQLSSVDPHSVMAHTNKSLYLMKLGNIEAAEAEKSKATLKTFEKLGREAQEKRNLEARTKAIKEDQEKRRKMFLQVLEIDPEDEIALYGLGDLAYNDGEYKKALEFFENVLKSNPKNSRAYLMAGKCLENLEAIEKARELYLAGIAVATKAGELMPANEMKSRLTSLT